MRTCTSFGRWRAYLIAYMYVVWSVACVSDCVHVRRLVGVGVSDCVHVRRLVGVGVSDCVHVRRLVGVGVSDCVHVRRLARERLMDLDIVLVYR